MIRTYLANAVPTAIASAAIVVAIATHVTQPAATTDWSAEAAKILQSQVDTIYTSRGDCTKDARLVDHVIVSNAPRSDAEVAAKVPPRHDTAVARLVTFDEAFAASMGRIEMGLEATVIIWGFCG